MKFFKFLSVQQNRHSRLTISPGFKDQVKKAIALYSEWESSIDDEEVLSRLVANGIDRYDATEILLFLPIAFVRHSLPQVDWPNTYLEYIDGKKSGKRKFSKTGAFIKISEVALEYFNNSPNANTILKIVGRSADFAAFNELFTANPNAKIEGISVARTIIAR